MRRKLYTTKPKRKRAEEWARKAERTREDWWRGWKRIKPVFGDCDPRTVTLENISAWRKGIEDTASLREAHRVLKIWRALWKVAAALKDARGTATEMQTRPLVCVTAQRKVSLP